MAADATPMLFDIFGECIAVHTDDAPLGRRIGSALAAFRVTRATEPCAAFHLRRCDADSPVRTGKQFNNGTLLVIGDRHKLITASLGPLPWQIHIEAFGRTDAYTYYYLFDPLLLMALKRRGLVHWHGAAVRHAARGVLIAGEGGAGKSTTTLCLLMHGAAFVADDELFLRLVPGGVCALGAERSLHCTDETMGLLGSPSPHWLPLVRRGSRDKRRLDAGRWRSARSSTDPPPPISVILFPRVEPGALTALRSLPPTEAMRRLILQRPKEHPAVIPDLPSLERQFAICGALAGTAQAFEVVLGRALEHLPRLIGEAVR